MWFLFGLVTLTGTVLLAIRDRQASGWGGEDCDGPSWSADARACKPSIMKGDKEKEE